MRRPGRSPPAGSAVARISSSSARRAVAATTSLSWAPGWPAPPPRPRCRSSAIVCGAWPFMIRPGALTAWPRKVGSTPRRTTRTTVTASSGSSTTLSRAATSGPRESNVYRLAELSVRIIDHAVAQGVPFAREYGGHLANRSFGGALVSRTFYARGLTGQQLLLGAYQALAKEESAGGVTMLARREMLDLLVVDG